MPSPKPTSKPVSKQEIVFNPPEVSFADVVDGIRVAAQYMKPLAIMLDNNQPEDLSEAGRERLQVVVHIANEGDGVLDERQAPAAVRPWFVDYVAAWGGFHDTLAAQSRTPASVSDHGERASRLLARVFPEGSSFLRKDAYAAWADGTRALKRVAELGLEGEIAAIAGSSALAGVKKVTTSLGEAIGLGKTPKQAPSSTKLHDTVAAFTREVARYARIIAAETDVTDAASVERYLRAVQRPLDTFRSRRNANGEVVEPVLPLEPVEPTEPGLTPPAPDQPSEPSA